MTRRKGSWDSEGLCCGFSKKRTCTNIHSPKRNSLGNDLIAVIPRFVFFPQNEEASQTSVHSWFLLGEEQLPGENECLYMANASLLCSLLLPQDT